MAASSRGYGHDSSVTADRPGASAAATPSALRRALNRYVMTAPSPSLDEIRANLWSAGRPPEDPDGRAALLEQYKMYVEMADRVSERRGTANTFFLSLNTAIAAAFTVFGGLPNHAHRWWLVGPWFVLVVQCVAWFWILRSYRQLNSAKYAVVGAIETQLPASPYWAAEWTALGSGRDPSRYWPLSHVESLIPALFAIAYTVGLVIALATG